MFSIRACAAAKTLENHSPESRDEGSFNILKILKNCKNFNMHQARGLGAAAGGRERVVERLCKREKQESLGNGTQAKRGSLKKLNYQMTPHF